MSIYFNVLVGTMSSGKTTFARRFWPQGAAAHHIMDERCPGAVEGTSPRDAVRRRAAEAWGGLRGAVSAWLASGNPPCFVADGLFMSRQARQAVLDLAPASEDVVRIGWFLDTPMQTVIKRFRGRVDAGEFRSVPKEVLMKQCLCFEMPSPEEQFDMWVRVPLEDQDPPRQCGGDPLRLMADRLMFADGSGMPRCDFLDEAAKVMSYRFRDMEAR